MSRPLASDRDAPMTPSVVVGTAGHVDHGKTELVKALTGINTDRLAEEQERQLSIDIGFAHLDLPSGVRVGIVDVPGHERFVKNMLAGATGIDLVMLIVAADEGVMPQTREHLDILTLLGVRSGLIVLTKSDLVDEEMLELVADDVRGVVAGGPLAEARMVATSARTDAGLDELVAALSEALAQVRPPDVRGPARLPIDRVFTMPGFGTVVTGTLIRGRLAVEDEVEILPHQFTARVRGLQVHGLDVEEVAAAKRVAGNLARLSGTGVERGDTLCAPGSMKPSSMIDVRLELLARTRAPLKQRTRVRLHHGTAEALGRVYFMDRELLEPGESCIAQLRLEGLIAASRDDRFVIRSYSPMFTIGGGVVLDPAPRRHRARDTEAVARLGAAETGQAVDVARQWIAQAKRPVFTSAELATDLQLDAADAKGIVQTLVQSGELEPLIGTEAFAPAPAHHALTESVLAGLGAYHQRNPLAAAMPKEALQAQVGRPPGALLSDVLRRLAEAGEIAVASEGVRVGTHEVRVSPEQQRSLEAMTALARRARFAPPTREAVLEAARARTPDEARALFAMLAASGELVAATEHVYHRDTLQEAERLIRAHVAEKGPFTIADLRDMTGSSRKYVVPLAEYLDGIGLTRRQGDLRTVAR